MQNVLYQKRTKNIKERIIGDIWTLFEAKEHKERLVKDRIVTDIRTFFEQQEDFYKPERVSNFWNNNYIEYESNHDKDRNLSLYEYLNKIKPYLRNIADDII